MVCTNMENNAAIEITSLFTQRHIYDKYRTELCTAFAHAGTRAYFERKQFIELSGNAADYIYLVQDGCVKQYLHSPNGVTRTIFLLAQGNTFNEVTLFNNDTSYVTSQAHSDVCLIRMAADEFNAILNAEPSLYRSMSYMLAYKLRIAMAQIYDLSFNSTEQRFRNLLCRLCVQIGRETSEGIIIPYIFTHDDFAQMISAGRSSISRIMGSFQDKGYILFEGKHIIIRPEIIGLGML